MKELYSLEIALRIFFKALSFCKSFSTSNTVIRYSIASERILTRVHDLGSLNMLFYFEGKYIDSSSELVLESDSLPSSLLKYFLNKAYFKDIFVLYYNRINLLSQNLLHNLHLIIRIN